MFFLNTYIKSLVNTFNIKTRATRSEFFTFLGINFSISLLLLLLNLNTTYELFSTLLIIPSISIGIRRFHDTGRPWWKSLYSLIPIFGFPYWLYVTFSKSEVCKNQYGLPQQKTLIAFKLPFYIQKNKEFNFEFNDKIN
jgi:uncharacterized membrane protein YhaH (DUF805 family)